MLIPTYFSIFLEKSCKERHAGVQPKGFFDDSLKVFHLIQVHHCGRAVRTFKNLLLLFICLVLEIVSSYISELMHFWFSVSFHKVHSMIFKALNKDNVQIQAEGGGIGQTKFVVGI